MAEPRLIHRIEDESGVGPFQNLDVAYAADLYVYNGDPAYPSPALDAGLGNDTIRKALVAAHGPDGLAIGCASADQLRYWFDADRCRTLADLGFYYTVWSCPPERCLEGAHQVVFDRTDADCIQRDPACQLWADERLAA